MSDEQTMVSGRFVVQRRLGAGGMGAVFEAFDRERQQVVAMKKLLHQDPGALIRLKNEFRSLADVVHPNLIPLYELIADGPEWFFTMELIDGVDFTSYLAVADPGPGAHVSMAKTERLSGDFDAAADAIAYDSYAPAHAPFANAGAPGAARLHRLRSAARQLAAGVVALHDAGKLHRDLKPSNVLVRPSGHVVILDFGLVADFDPESNRAITLAGTPAYMSPEQIQRLPITPASDWYAVGVMLYEALTARLPFDGNPFAIAVQKQNSDPVPPRAIVPQIPQDLNDLCLALLARQPADRPQGRDVLLRLGEGEARPAARPATRDAPFVGREHEMRELFRAAGVLRDSRPATVLLHGRSGIGKTTLVQHFLAELLVEDADTVVLRGRCYEQESVPYKAVDSLVDDLMQYVKRLSPIEAKAIVPPDIAMLARLFPVLEPLEATIKRRRRAADVPDAHELRRRAFGALREMLTRIAEIHQLVLFLDDIQWGDRDSASILAALLGPPDPPPILTLLTYRTEEGRTSELVKEVQQLRTNGLLGEVSELAIPGLSFEEACLLVRGVDERIPPAHLDAIARGSDGSPLFAGEMVRFWSTMGREEAPATVDELILARVSALPDDARRVLEVVAVAGRPVERAAAEQAAGIDSPEAVLVLRAHHLLRTRVAGGREELVPAHDRFREVVAAAVGEEQRVRDHLALAHALEASGRRDPEMLATHYAEAREHEKAASYAAAAAAKAAEALAFDHAAQLYRFALELRPTISGSDELRVHLGDALSRAGRGAEAAAVYLEVAESAEPAQRLELRRLAAENLLRVGHVDEGLAVIRDVLASVGMKLPPTPWRLVLGILLQRMLLKLRGFRVLRRARRDAPSELLTRRLDVCWSVCIGLSRIDNLRAAYFQAIHLRLALEARDPYRLARALTIEAGLAAVRNKWGKRYALRVAGIAERQALHLGDSHAIGLSMLASGVVHYYEARFRATLVKALGAEAMFRDRCTGATWEINTAQAYANMSLGYLGDLDELARRVPAQLRDAEERGDLYASTDPATRSAIVWLAADDPETARRVVHSLMSRWSLESFHSQHFWYLYAETQADLYAGDCGEIWARIEKLWPVMSRSLFLRIQFIRIEALHMRARAAAAVARSKGRTDLVAVIERDARIVAKQRIAWSAPLANMMRASAASIRGDDAEAAASLRAAVDGFVQMEMKLYAAAARWRLGHLLAGDEGAALVEAGEGYMRSQGVKVPERMANLLAPM